jgi:bifunctional enzyme CysN/CysC
MSGPEFQLRERYARVAAHLGLAPAPDATARAPQSAHQFETVLVWLHGRPMLPGRAYLVTVGDAQVRGTIDEPKYRIDVETLEHLAARTLGRDEIGVCNLLLDEPVPFSPYAEDAAAGTFRVLDGVSGEALGAGAIRFALRRAHNIHPQALDVDKRARSKLKGQRPCVVWFTGLSGAGKSTIANRVEKRLVAMQRHTYLLDGDNVRHGLNRDLGFTDADRVENIRRIGEVAKLMVDAGLIVICSFISPFRAERRFARGLVAEGEFIEVYVDTPLETAERRDPKGLYKKARRGELKNFTGIDSPYEPPEHAELRVHAGETSPDQAAEQVIELLRRRGMLD